MKNSGDNRMEFQELKTLLEEISRQPREDGQVALSSWAKDNFDRIFSDQLTDADIIDLVEIGDWPLTCEFAKIASVERNERYDSFCTRLSRSIRCVDGEFVSVPFSVAEEGTGANGCADDECLADCVAHEHSGDCSRVHNSAFHLLTAYVKKTPERFFALLGNLPQCDVMYSLVHFLVLEIVRMDSVSADEYIQKIQIPVDGTLVPFVVLFQCSFHELVERRDDVGASGIIRSLLLHLIENCGAAERREYAIVMVAWLIRVSRAKAIFDKESTNENSIEVVARLVLRELEKKITEWKCAANNKRFLSAFGIDNWLADLSCESFRKTGICRGVKRNFQLYFITASSLGLEATDRGKQDILLGVILWPGVCGCWRSEKFSVLAICMADLLASCLDPIKAYTDLIAYCDQALHRLRFAQSDQHAFSSEDRLGLLVETGICLLDKTLNAEEFDVCDAIFNQAWKVVVNLLYISILPKRMVDYVRYLFVYRVKLAVARHDKVELLQLLSQLPRPVLYADHIDDCYNGCLKSVALNFADLSVIRGVDEKLYFELQDLDVHVKPGDNTIGTR